MTSPARTIARTSARYIGQALAGALLMNAVPHGVNAVMGRRFPSPFATPPGVGLSRPPVNVVWSALNATAGSLLLRRGSRSRGDVVARAAGAAGAALFLAQYFSGVQEAASAMSPRS